MSFLFDPSQFNVISAPEPNETGQTLIVEHKKLRVKYYANILLLPDLLNNEETISNFKRAVDNLCCKEFESIHSVIGYSLTDFEGNSNPVVFHLLIEEDVKSLSDFSISQEKENLSNKLILVYGVLAGLCFLHNNNITFGLFFRKNILIDSNSNPFLTKYGYYQLFSESYIQDQQPIVPEFISEAQNFGKFTKETDIFFLGDILYNILTGENEEGISSHPFFKPSFPQNLRNIIIKCWNKIPSNRPTIDEIIETFDQEIQNMQHFNSETFNSYFSKLFIVPRQIYDSLSQANRKQIRIAAYGNRNNSDNSKDTRLFLGKNFIFGKNSFPQNIKIGKKYIDKLNEENFASSLFFTGKLYEKGISALFPKKLETAIQFYEKAAALGDVCSMSRLAELYSTDDTKLAEAFHYCKKVSDAGSLEALNLLGTFYHEGKGTNKDDTMAVQCFKTAAEKGNIKGIINYGTMLRFGLGVERNYEESYKYLKIGASLDQKNAAFQFASLLNDENSNLCDKKEAEKQFKIAAENGHVEAMRVYGLMLWERPECRTISMDFLQQAANLGDPISMVQYALRIRKCGDDDGDVKSEETASKFFQKAAELGNKEGLFNYAKALEMGEGVPLCTSKALQIYKMLIDSGYTPANDCYNRIINNRAVIKTTTPPAILGQKSDEKPNIATKIKFAADGGDPIAMVNFGLILEKGNGVVKNDHEAAKYYKMSADKGNSYGMLMYAKMLEEGKGVPQNKLKAGHYYKKSAEAGNSKAMFKVGQLHENQAANDNLDITSIHFYRLSAEHGNPQGIKKFVQIISECPYLEPDESIAMSFFKKASDKNDPIGQCKYGQFLLRPENKEKDYKEGARLVKSAADSKNIEAMNMYAYIMTDDKYGMKNVKESLNYYLKAAAENNTTGMVNAGYLLQNGGDDIELDLMKSAKLFKKAAELGDPCGMYNYGVALLYGNGVPQNSMEAVKYFRMAVIQNHSDSMVLLGSLYEKGDGVVKDWDEALKLYMMAINLQNPEAMVNFSCLVVKKNPPDFSLSVKYIKMAAKLQYPDGLNMYGMKLLTGFGVERDYEGALKYFKMAIDLGSTIAICNYGYMLESGRGVNKDYKKALEQYELALSEDESTGMYYIGLLKINGHILERDFDAAENYFKIAIEEEVEDAAFSLGWMYERGVGVDKDESKAFQLYKQATIDCSIKGFLGMGRLYSLGRGVDQDLEASESYFKSAQMYCGLEELVEIGLNFEYGEAMPMDEEYAALCYRIAADGNNQKGVENYERFIRKHENDNTY